MKVCLPVNNSFRKTRNNLFLCGLIVCASAGAFHTTWTFCQFFFRCMSTSLKRYLAFKLLLRTRPTPPYTSSEDSVSRPTWPMVCLDDGQHFQKYRPRRSFVCLALFLSLQIRRGARRFGQIGNLHYSITYAV